MIDEKGLARKIAPFVPSNLEIRTTPWGMGEDAEIFFVEKGTERRHLVSVQLGEGYAVLNKWFYEHKYLDGVTGGVRVARMEGTESDNVDPNPAKLGPKLAQALLGPDDFELKRQEGFASHPLFEGIWDAVQEAMAGRKDLWALVNREASWIGPEEDLIEILGEGDELIASVSTGAGMAVVKDHATGETSMVSGAKRLPEVADLLRTAFLSSTGPRP